MKIQHNSQVEMFQSKNVQIFLADNFQAFLTEICQCCLKRQKFEGKVKKTTNLTLVKGKTIKLVD